MEKEEFNKNYLTVQGAAVMIGGDIRKFLKAGYSRIID